MISSKTNNVRLMSHITEVKIVKFPNAKIVSVYKYSLPLTIFDDIWNYNVRRRVFFEV